MRKEKQKTAQKAQKKLDELAGNEKTEAAPGCQGQRVPRLWLPERARVFGGKDEMDHLVQDDSVSRRPSRWLRATCSHGWSIPSFFSMPATSSIAVNLPQMDLTISPFVVTFFHFLF